MSKPSHELNRDHKRALASARRAIRRAIDKVGLVYNTDLVGKPGYDEDTWTALNLLQQANALLAKYAQNRYKVSSETLDRY